jgi:hypothetical protein
MNAYRERREFIPGGEVVVVDIWDGGRAARREIPFSSQSECLPSIPDSAVNPPTTVHDAGAIVVDAAIGVPIRLISTEHPPGVSTKHVGLLRPGRAHTEFPCP